MGFMTLSLGFMFGTGVTLYSSELTYNYIFSYLYYPHKDYLDLRRKLKGYVIPVEVHNSYWINVFRGNFEFWYHLPSLYRLLYDESADITNAEFVSDETQLFKTNYIETTAQDKEIEENNINEETKRGDISFKDSGKV